jgi:ABC-type phosphate transport system substrate-binding protein
MGSFANLTRMTALALGAGALLGGAARAADPLPFANIDEDAKAAVMNPAVQAAPTVASVVHLEGFKPGQLKLSGPILADIYLGNITRWDAPQIASLNPGMSLPHKPIVVVHRADRSDASLGFSGYLAMQSPTFRAEVGAGDDVRWPVGMGGDGDAGVAALVEKTEDAIGYVDYGFAKRNGLSVARLIDGKNLPVRAVGAPSPTVVVPVDARPAGLANIDTSSAPMNDAQ